MDLRPRRVVRSELLFGGNLLRLDGVLYMLLRFPGRVELTKEDGTLYVVDAARCSCPASRFRLRERCKHRSALEKHGLLPTPASRPSFAAG